MSLNVLCCDALVTQRVPLANYGQCSTHYRRERLQRFSDPFDRTALKVGWAREIQRMFWIERQAARRRR